MISPEILFNIQRLGEIIKLEPNQILFQKGDNPDYLYIILEGDIFVEIALKQIWVGPGDIIGEIGFILGCEQTISAKAGSSECILWTIHRSFLFQKSKSEISTLMAYLVIALSPHIQTRLLEIMNDYRTISSNLIEHHCDYDHSSIQYAAALLRGKDDWESAMNVWKFVQSMPYRFGLWHKKASQILELGFGMCTTKANLQVALLRALGIESQFGEIQLYSKYLKPLLNPNYHYKIRNLIKHYFCIVKLDGQWFCSDASFSKGAAEMIVESYPQFSYLIYQTFQKAQHFRVEMENEKFEYNRMSNLSHLMLKKPFYRESNAEAMNILLDKKQNVSWLVPHWVKPTLKLLNYNPNMALIKAMARIALDLEQLRSIIDKQQCDENF